MKVKSKEGKNIKLKGLIGLGLAGLLSAAVWLGAGPARAQSPDFSTVDDPLDGNYQLFRVDDLVVTRPVAASANSTGFGYDILLTEDQEIQSEAYDKIAQRPCIVDLNQSQGTAVGRFFGVTNDVMVSVIPFLDQDCAPTDHMEILVQDPVTGTITSSSIVDVGFQSFTVAADDFDADGFDDLFIITESSVLVATANNNSSGSPTWSSGTANSGSLLAFQGDGNLVVIRDAAGTAIFESITADGQQPGEQGGRKLILFSDGRLVIVNGAGEVIWQVGTPDGTTGVTSVSVAPTFNYDTSQLVTILTTPDLSYRLNWQRDGNLVLYRLSRGMVFGPATPIDSYMKPLSDLATGDLNGDGLIDVAWVNQQNEVMFATVCAGPTEGTVCEDEENFAVLINPLASATTSASIVARRGCSGGVLTQARPRVVAGKFSSTGTVGLVVIDLWACSVFATWYEFNSDFTLLGGGNVGTLELVPAGNDPNLTRFDTIMATPAKLDWFGSTEQVVISTSQDYDGEQIFKRRFRDDVVVLSFNNDQMQSNGWDQLSPGFNALALFEGVWPIIVGVAAGHYSTVDDSASEEDFNLHIAVKSTAVGVNADQSLFYVNDILRIFSVEAPTDFTPILTPKKSLTTKGPYSSLLNSMMAGDLQGRSQRLGAPTVMRIQSHSQPSIVLGAPPMHIDYVLPFTTSTSDTAQIINFSVVPRAYHSQYNMVDTQSSQSSDTNTTSYSYATSESGAGGIKMGVPYVGGISGSTKTTSKESHEQMTKDFVYTENEFKYNASTETGFGDQVWFQETSFNVYYYPVLGETICPDDNPSCSEEEELPLFVQFSGPNTTGVTSASGASLEWYQPVHEPGQIFSYPWDLSQLESRTRDFEKLSSALQFLTDDSTTSQSLQWTGGTGTSSSVGTTQTHSHDTNQSISAGNIGKVAKTGFGFNASDTIDVNNSSSMSTLNTASSKMGASAGVEIAKPGNFLDPVLYQYQVAPFIFGQAPPTGTVDTVSQSEPTDIVTTGAIQTAFTADPTTVSSGSWWTSSSPYKQYVDLALNHPVRWEWTPKFNMGNDLSCLLAEGSSFDCFDIKEAVPDDPWNSAFYWMRGLLVTVSSFDGPQRTVATVGDEVFLQARVYNYSLKDMAADDTIKVRFYRQEIDTNNLPLGDSVDIATVDVAPLPGFNSLLAPSTPNWTTARTTFDTTGLGDRNFIFWVVTWLEDANGALVGELPGHGLSEQPDALITSIGDVVLEEVSITGSDGATKSVSFSNNVGMLKMAFYVAPETAEPFGSQRDPELYVLNADVTPWRAQVGEEVIVSADIFSANAASDHAVVRFYDREVGDGVHVFDVEAMPHIRADESRRVSVPFRPQACGTYRFTISARLGAISEASGITHLTVPCKDGLVEVCHKGKRTMKVSGAALDAHLAHGDTLGPCP